MTKPKAKPAPTTYTPRFGALTTEVDTTQPTPEYTGYLTVKETRQFDGLNYNLEGVIQVKSNNNTGDQFDISVKTLRWVHEIMPGNPGWSADADNKKTIPFSPEENPVMAKGMLDYCQNEERASDILFLSGVKPSTLKAKPKMRM